MKARRSEQGSALIVVLLIVFFLGAVWAVGLKITGDELERSGNFKMAESNFYATEAALVMAYESPAGWMTDTFLSDALNNIGTASLTTTMYHPVTGQPIADLTFRPIQDDDSAAAAANNLPVQAHTTSPPNGSGYGLNKFVVRRFGIDAVSATGKQEIQAGVWIVLNK